MQCKVKSDVLIVINYYINNYSCSQVIGLSILKRAVGILYNRGAYISSTI